MGKKDKPPEGCPDWMVTYGDMMTLLMCFFVMLVAISNFDELKIQQAVGSFQFYLGNPDALMTTQLDQITHGNSLMEKVQTLLDKAKDRQKAESGQAVHQSPLGKDVMVESLEKGLRITIGGKTFFRPNEYVIDPENRAAAEEVLDKVAGLIRGYPNRIEITGHCTPDPEELKGTDQWDLSYRRAKTVALHFINARNEADRIPAHRFRLIGHGTGNPIGDNFTETIDSRFGNRRVEILLARDTVPLGVE